MEKFKHGIYFAAVIHLLNNNINLSTSALERKVMDELCPSIPELPLIFHNVEWGTKVAEIWNKKFEIENMIKVSGHGTWGVVSWSLNEGKEVRRKVFVADGRGSTTDIVALNDVPDHIEILARLVSHDVAEAKRYAYPRSESANSLFVQKNSVMGRQIIG